MAPQYPLEGRDGWCEGLMEAVKEGRRTPRASNGSGEQRTRRRGGKLKDIGTKENSRCPQTGSKG